MAGKRKNNAVEKLPLPVHIIACPTIDVSTENKKKTTQRSNIKQKQHNFTEIHRKNLSSQNHQKIRKKYRKLT
jgi:hypothetical protein